MLSLVPGPLLPLFSGCPVPAMVSMIGSAAAAETARKRQAAKMARAKAMRRNMAGSKVRVSGNCKLGIDHCKLQSDFQLSPPVLQFAILNGQFAISAGHF